MEFFLLASCVILLITTGFYAWFSHKTLKHIQAENNAYKFVLERQLKISAFPHLYCDMQGGFQSNGVKLELLNIGSIPAYDIHLSVIGAYTEESMDIPNFMRNFVQPRFRKYPLQVDKVGYYGVRSSVRCPLLPFQKKVVIALSFPLCPVDIYALIQYREILGGNYYQVYCFSDLDEQGNYRANILEPAAFEPLERLHFYDMDDAGVSIADKSLPYYVSDFVDLWNHALSHRMMTVYSEEINALQEVHDV
jgi:hypothetical protein